MNERENLDRYRVPTYIRSPPSVKSHITAARPLQPRLVLLIGVKNTALCVSAAESIVQLLLTAPCSAESETV